MIAIINYGMGNLGSIENILKKIGVKSIITDDVDEISKSDKLILPGVGAFDNGMKKLKNLNLIPVLNDLVLKQKKPILGICLGMQLLCNSSKEGIEKGLGYIDTEIVKFDNSKHNIKIPHMGWNIVNILKDSRLFENSIKEQRFYFVHSYHVPFDETAKNPDWILTTTNHGYEFVSSVERGNIFGTQFHPEKSHKFGMNLLEKFSKL